MELKNVGVILLMVISLIKAEVINHGSCSDVSSEKCTIPEVNINPCKENPKPCKLKKGTTANITFDFVPNFDATKLKSMVWYKSPAGEIEFPGFDNDACPLTQCPTKSGQSQQYNYQLTIKKIYPSGVFPIKWKLWNEEDESQACCFETNINLRR